MPVTGTILSRADLLTSLNADIKNSPATLIRGDVMAQKVADLQVSSVNILTDYSATYSTIVRQGTTSISNIVIGPSTILGRLATGAIVALSGSDVSAIIGASMSGGISVAAATTGNITMSGIQTIDGVTTPASVLVWMQTNPVENGVYVPAAGAWTRATNSDATAELQDQIVIPAAGTLYGGHVFGQTTDTPVIATDNITYVDYGTTGGIFVTQAPSGTQVNGQLAFWTGTQRRLSKGWTNLFWDHPNKRLGVGTNTPGGRLDIVGVGTSTGIAFRVRNSTPAVLMSFLDNGGFSIGLGTIPSGPDETKIGNAAVADTGGTAIGSGTNSHGGVVVGYQASSTQIGGTALGNFASVIGAAGIAIGAQSSVAYIDGIAIGEFAQSNQEGTITLGGSNQGGTGCVNNVAGSFKVALSWLSSSRPAETAMLLYNTGNLLLYHKGLITQSMFQPAWTAPMDYVAENVLTLHNAKTPTAITVTSVANVGGFAWLTHAGTSNFDQPESGCKVTLSGFGVYTDGVYYAHFQNQTQISLHPTRIDALAITNSVAFISTDTGTVTFSPLSPDPTGPIADTIALFSHDTDENNASLGLQMDQAVVTETVTSDRTLKIRINGVQYKLCLKV